MSASGERGSTWLHATLAVATVALVATSPWIALRRSIPDDATWLDWAHVVAGVLVLLLGFAYAAACLRGGGWRELLPWASGRLGAVGRDLAELLRGAIPTAEGGGLFALLKGFVLLALLATAITGAGWLLVQGTPDAFAWRRWHAYAADAFAGLLVAHVVAVALHVVAIARG